MRFFNRHRLGAAAAILALSTLTPIASAQASGPADQHCVLQVTGKLASGELTTGSYHCYASAAAAAAAGPLSLIVIARHYTGYNFTGSELDIYGSGCNGGWLNMPSGWVNVIASTLSGCTVDHYYYYNLTGTVQRLYAPGGNLTYMYKETASAQYL